MLEGGINAHPLLQGHSFNVYYWVLWIYQKHWHPLGGDTTVWGTRMRIRCGTKVFTSLPIFFLGIKLCLLLSHKQVQNHFTTNKSQDSPILSSCLVLDRTVFDYWLLPTVLFKHFVWIENWKHCPNVLRGQPRCLSNQICLGNLSNQSEQSVNPFEIGRSCQTGLSSRAKYF